MAGDEKQNMDKWYSVNSLLPTKKSLLYVPNFGMFIGELAWGRWEIGDGRFLRFGAVSHWMPLPSRPQKD